MDRRSVPELIKTRLGNAKSLTDAAQVWTDHQDELEGCLFVLSSRDGEQTTRWPPTLDLTGDGYLRSVFAHSHLSFVSHEILQAMFGPARKVNLQIDYSIAFDTNAASRLRAMVEGSTDSTAAGLREVLRELTGRKSNWDLMPFFAERSRDLQGGDPRALDGIWRAVRAVETFAACDQEEFVATGAIRTIVSQADIDKRAHEQLVMWDRTLKAGLAERLADEHRLYYAMALEIALIEHASPGPQTSGHKVHTLLEFMHTEISAMFLDVIWAAGSFFSLGGRFRALSKLIAGRETLKMNAANVAWDLHHLSVRRQYAAPIGRNGAFHIPYFLTFDRGLADLFSGFTYRSCLIESGTTFPQFFPEFDFHSWLFGSWPDLSDSAGTYFTIEAHRRRSERTSSLELRPYVAALVARLEKQVEQLS